MKFSDEAWELYCRTFKVADSEREEIEQTTTAWREGFLQEAGGDEEKALGLATLALVRDMAKDFGLPEQFLLRAIIDNTPAKGRDRMRRALRRVGT